MKSFAFALLLHLSSAATTLPARPLSDPHFPSHQLSSTAAITSTSSPQPQHHVALFDNHPVTPPHNSPSSHALAAATPLESSYLQSLANPATHPASRDPLVHAQDRSNPPSSANPDTDTDTDTDSALPSKPTSALAVLRKEDEARYWAAATALKKAEHAVTTIAVDVGTKPTSQEAFSFSSGILRTVRISPEHKGVASRLYGGSPLMIAREYSDVLVVGVVLIFLVLVLVLEAKERCATVKKYRRGQIYLDDGFDALYVVGKPLFLHPAPQGRLQSTWARKSASYVADSGSDTAVEEDGGFENDGWAYEKV